MHRDKGYLMLLQQGLIGPTPFDDGHRIPTLQRMQRLSDFMEQSDVGQDLEIMVITQSIRRLEVAITAQIVDQQSVHPNCLEMTLCGTST